MCKTGIAVVSCKPAQSSVPPPLNDLQRVRFSGDRIYVRDGAKLLCKVSGIGWPWVWNVAEWADEIKFG